ncbi:hypothetical protein [Algoriphagus sp. A40]|uniref:hypothetical protein n=1 Tax=Algoriphagus sp. A40 TaxID=1945863 RepID=UPI0009878FB5|nr:hypothetical protein [Algoriphagus sp. A40]OOG74284.1 hypothetical protein B0E43_11800 [Algoriphagus sp. A40]
MLVSNFENGAFWILAILVIGCLALLHYLLFREYVEQKKNQIQRYKDFEKLINLEINRSQSLSHAIYQHQDIREKTDEKLEVIKLQVEGMKLREEKGKID